jgi:hypothetical protein
MRSNAAAQKPPEWINNATSAPSLYIRRAPFMNGSAGTIFPKIRHTKEIPSVH